MLRRPQPVLISAPLRLANPAKLHVRAVAIATPTPRTSGLGSLTLATCAATPGLLAVVGIRSSRSRRGVRVLANGSSALVDVDKKGAFTRAASQYRHTIGEGSRFPVEAGRYHLYISAACPWANGTLAMLFLKGLDDVISYSITHPVWGRTRPDKDDHSGWQFRDPADPPVSNPTGKGSFSCAGCVPDAVNGCTFVRDLYEKSAEQNSTARYTVPVLWDKKEGTIVNNESYEILKILNSAFGDLAKSSTDFFPADKEKEIAETYDWVYNSINNGVYRCGFAQSQEAYDDAIEVLYKGLDRAEAVLSKSRYLCGDVMTAIDLRAFMTLIRFDEVYEVYFKTNKKLIREYPNLLDFTRELYQMEPIRRTIQMNHIKAHYFASHPNLNYLAIIPVGRGTEIYDEPHNRSRL